MISDVKVAIMMGTLTEGVLVQYGIEMAGWVWSLNAGVKKKQIVAQDPPPSFSKSISLSAKMTEGEKYLSVFLNHSLHFTYALHSFFSSPWKNASFSSLHKFGFICSDVISGS